MGERAPLSAAGEQHGAGGARLKHGQPPAVDPTLEHPRCVFQVLKRHYSRYTPEMVERVCGVPRERLVEVAEALCQNSGRERTSAFVYSVGWTQHSVGVQYIRTAAIIQLLLGNMGRPGGGIMALRGHASIQGSTDIPTLYNLLPGYLPMPHADRHHSLQEYLDDVRLPAGFFGHADEYANELLAILADPNVHIMEAKAATCDVRPGRRPRGPDLDKLVDEHRRRALGPEGGGS